jgi:hypothetical protein
MNNPNIAPSAATLDIVIEVTGPGMITVLFGLSDKFPPFVRSPPEATASTPGEHDPAVPARFAAVMLYADPFLTKWICPGVEPAANETGIFTEPTGAEKVNV